MRGYFFVTQIRYTSGSGSLMMPEKLRGWRYKRADFRQMFHDVVVWISSVPGGESSFFSGDARMRILLIHCAQV